MSITYTNVNFDIDGYCQGLARLFGANGYGVGGPGDTTRAWKAASDVETAILATVDSSIIVGTPSAPGMAADAKRFKDSLDPRKIGTPRSVLNRIERQVRVLKLTGVNSLDQFLTYYNGATHGPNLALQNQYFREMFYEWKGSYPTATNLYFEVLLNAVFRSLETDTLVETTFSNGLRQLLVGTGQTAGYDITTDYAGGVPYLLVSGFAGSSDTVTVTGTEDYHGVRTAGKTWTATVTGNGPFALSVGTATANALIAAASGIVAGANITASTLITVEAHKPSGRLAVPA